MHSPALPHSPLTVVYTTLQLCTLASTALLVALVFALIEPVWSRAALALQAVTLVVAGLAARWRPPRRIAIYALLLAVATLVWDPTLPPTHLPKEQARHLLPLVVSVVVLADLLLRRDTLSFRLARIEVYAGLVDLTEAAVFFRSNPAHLHARLVARNTPLVSAPDGSTLVALEAVLAVLHEPGPDPGGRGSVQSLRD